MCDQIAEMGSNGGEVTEYYFDPVSVLQGAVFVSKMNIFILAKTTPPILPLFSTWNMKKHDAIYQGGGVHFSINQAVFGLVGQFYNMPPDYHLVYLCSLKALLAYSVINLLPMSSLEKAPTLMSKYQRGPE